MNKYRLLFFSTICMALVGCKTNFGEEASPRPNILFIMSDDHTSQAWGLYGGVLKDYVKTPNIQRLAEEGMVLQNVFCTNSICTPSRATILTGQYSHHNGVYTLSGKMDPDSMHIAKVLKQSGYQTAIIGKWHLKAQPAGFDHFNVLPGQGRYHDPVLRTREHWEEGKTYEGFSTDVITDLSLEWLEKRDPERPFMLMTHFKATHEPFDYPERHAGLYQDVELPEPASLYEFSPAISGRSFTGQIVENLGERWEKESQKPESQWTRYPGLPFSREGLDSTQARRKIYQKFVKDFLRSGAAIDDNIGRLLDYLEANGLSENTVVIYTADQGYFLGEHGFMDKRMIYEEALRMPFVIRYPPEIAGGSRLDDMVLNIDFPALFADYAGLPNPEFVQGRSFRANLGGAPPGDWRKDMYYRYWLHRVERPAHFGIRTERYKLAFFYGHPLGMPGAMPETTPAAWEFYDLKDDPQELRNAYWDPKYSAVIKELKSRLQQLRENLDDTDAHRPEMQRVIAESWE